jgi:hypothetical protein
MAAKSAQPKRNASVVVSASSSDAKRQFASVSCLADSPNDTTLCFLLLAFWDHWLTIGS